MDPGGGRKLARTGMRNKLVSLHGLSDIYLTDYCRRVTIVTNN